MEPPALTKASRMSRASNHSLATSDVHLQCNTQIDELRQRIKQLEAKNKDYLDKLANPMDEGKAELIKQTKQARKSGIALEQEAIDVLDETLEELVQK